MNNRKIRNWVATIKRVMNDFYVPIVVQNEIIDKVKAERKQEDTAIVLYNRAWRMFYGYINANL